MSALSQSQAQREKEIELWDKEAAKRRKEGGTYLKMCRERLGLTQRELAHEVGFLYYTKISAIENGREKVPPEFVLSYGLALKVADMREFTLQMIRFFEPHYDKGLRYNHAKK